MSASRPTGRASRAASPSTRWSATRGSCATGAAARPATCASSSARSAKQKDTPAGRLAWLRGAIAIERYRLTYGIDDDRSALGRPPATSDPRRPLYDAALAAIGRAREQLGLDLDHHDYGR